MTKKDLIEQREQIQHDLLCLLDGLEQGCLDCVCQIVVDRFQLLIDQCEQENEMEIINELDNDYTAI